MAVHRLVMAAFVGPCPDGIEVCHNNGNPADNRLSNLRYGTHSENQLDQVKHKTHYFANKTHCPRGHLLSAPNLVAAPAKRGYRTCLACSRAKSYARKYDMMHLFEGIADQKYAEIMS